ncbi:dATP/dGTP diphosphohydrolase domain-containing protein [Komagataeibacter xylinus]|uniref:dATP/dGTP diphosphohydrolase domain-containing protein n=1 Tax=Komagataeibacter xylinus TaxID=28448 RepID=UPI00280BD7FB|nr:dATP/dGTP diphosphohydrolase domain-containing protein [Komagataeibacter xylinus]
MTEQTHTPYQRGRRAAERGAPRVVPDDIHKAETGEDDWYRGWDSVPANPPTEDRAERHNHGKARLDYLPPDVMTALAEHMTKSMGPGKKYPERNWEKGMPLMTCYASLLRHLFAWAQGEDRDKESGSLHLVCVLWNAMAMVAYTLRGVGKDDRPSSNREAA